MTHPHGSFCFAELHTSDLDAARQFYGTVFGWEAVDVPGADGSYALFRLGGKDVAGVRRANGPARWVPYLSVENTDRTAARAMELRANILTAPYEMQGFGRLAVVHDPAGGIVGLWQARGHQGAALLDEPGSLWWCELLTRDVQGAKTFYSGLMGWRPVDTLKYGIRYTVFKQGEDSRAGLLPVSAEWGPVTPYWQVLFAVDSADAGIERAKFAGGSLVYGPNDVPNAGRAAIITDPNHAVFVLMKPNET